MCYPFETQRNIMRNIEFLVEDVSLELFVDVTVLLALNFHTRFQPVNCSAPEDRQYYDIHHYILNVKFFYIYFLNV